MIKLGKVEEVRDFLVLFFDKYFNNFIIVIEVVKFLVDLNKLKEVKEFIEIIGEYNWEFYF